MEHPVDNREVVSSILTPSTIDILLIVVDNKSMARRRCSRCSRFIKKGTIGKLCPRCKGKRKRVRKARGKVGTREQSILNLKHCHDYLATHSCVDCGESDIIVLQFDHVRGKKRGNVSSLARQGVSLDIVIMEIKKCEIRCANCHVRKTAKEQGWYKARPTTN